MDGSVRLWDMSIKKPEQQCIRYWQTGARRRVLCVGMNSRVVVCGNANSTLCVWDIHLDPNSPSSSHGTIHATSFLSSAAPPGLEDWTSGIEHICVGDSLVACSTEFSGSVLVFSLATGSLVYEIPGLYQPSKMCMTDFFLLTGGRGAWNQGGNTGHHQQQHHGSQHASVGQHANRPANTEHDDDDSTDQLEGQSGSTMEVDDYMSCCINVWDLKTGNRLYSLIPRLPLQHLQQTRGITSTLNNPQSLERRYNAVADLSNRPVRTTIRSSAVGMVQQNGISSHANPGYQSPNAASSYDLDDVNSIGSTTESTTQSSFFGSGRQLHDSVRSSNSPAPPQSPISAPLTLLDIAVTPDHSTLVATLCERSGEGREGVYCWDFSGSRLEGYHEQSTEVSTMVLDKTDIEYDQAYDSDGSDIDSDTQPSSDLLGGEEGQAINDEDERFSNDRFDNNMVMQQVDSTALRNLHQARVTGKVWIGWKLDERKFQRRKAVYQSQWASNEK
ncbi:hypothetical protein BGX27_000830 [Mortierella sp. AM989]|nr:hypothetical protein BGX27_000830 [Mortierella sp. AM989]